MGVWTEELRGKGKLEEEGSGASNKAVLRCC